jgi:hypothetical protein
MFQILTVPKQQWTWDGEQQNLSNKWYGSYRVVNICDKNGKFLYQQVVWSESRGEINIIVDLKGRIAFVEKDRHAVLRPELYAETWKEPPDILHYNYGMTLLEMPRGFTNKLLGEIEEETRFLPGPIVYSFHLNGNTASCVTSPFVFVTMANPIPSDAPVDPHEKINQVMWIPARDIRKVDTICALTLASLFKFQMWARKQDNPFWNEVGNQI